MKMEEAVKEILEKYIRQHLKVRVEVTDSIDRTKTKVTILLDNEDVDSDFDYFTKDE